MTHYFRFIFLLAVMLHYSWAGLLIADSSPLHTTPIHQTAVLFGRWPTTATFIIVASAALLAIVWRPLGGWLLMPQTAVLLSATAGGLYAALVGHYADGVMRPWQFILADQILLMLLAFLHLVAVLLIVQESERAQR